MARVLTEPERVDPGRMRRIVDFLELRRPELQVLALLFIAADLFLMLAYLYFRLESPESWPWDIRSEHGLGERYQSLKQFWCVVVLGVLWVRRRSFVVFAWAVVMAYYLVDDSRRIHERMSVYLVEQVDLGISTSVGEFIWYAAVGATLILLVALGYRRADEVTKRLSRKIAGYFVALIVCGVALDFLHDPFVEIVPIDIALTFLEDGGEQVILSALTAFLICQILPGGDRRAGPSSTV
ncbi:hypothetical protein [Occultella kanbiaonis]|uniref:hypothetical protein n=1 Tax=Occultella kanbiaonis TaxID=2675754 RepID=UPI0012B85C1E|nr:hypothetical protein [Occultella kanbiaonis]